MKCENKKAQVLGEGIIMMYRLFLVALVAFIVLGVSSVFYAHSINVRSAEAIIMTRNVVECLINKNLDFDRMMKEESGILSECGYDKNEVERFYVNVSIKNEKKEYFLSEGDSGATWVLEIFKDNETTKSIQQFRPGYYPFDFVLNHKEEEYNVKVEVLVNEEL